MVRQSALSVHIDSGNGLVPSGNKPLPETMLTKFNPLAKFYFNFTEWKYISTHMHWSISNVHGLECSLPSEPQTGLYSFVHAFMQSARDPRRCLLLQKDMSRRSNRPSALRRSTKTYSYHCPACRTTFIATRFRVAVICPIIPVPHCIRVFFYFVWFVFINHIFQFYYELCTYCNILDIYLS